MRLKEKVPHTAVSFAALFGVTPICHLQKVYGLDLMVSMALALPPLPTLLAVARPPQHLPRARVPVLGTLIQNTC